MKAAVSLFLAILLTATALCGCANADAGNTAAVKVSAAVTENMITESKQPTASSDKAETTVEDSSSPAADEPTEKSVKELHVIDLLKKPVSAIKNLIGEDDHSERVPLSDTFSDNPYLAAVMMYLRV